MRRQPFVLPIHNLWWAKKLNDINYGKRTFRMWDGFPGWADLLHLVFSFLSKYAVLSVPCMDEKRASEKL